MDFRGIDARQAAQRVVIVVATLALVCCLGFLVKVSLPGLFDNGSAKARRTSAGHAPSSAPESQSGVQPSDPAVTGLNSAAADRAADLAKLAQQAERRNRRIANHKPVAAFVMASFNVLGDSHTRAGGKDARMASGARRTHGVVDLLRRHHVDLVSLQEFQKPQVLEFARIAGEYSMYPGTGARAIDSENSVAWRTDTFDLVKTGTKSYPYFGRSWRDYPEILLRHKATGVEFWVTSYHNPANTREHGNQQRNKARALAMQVVNTNNVLKVGTPMLIAGDMNDRDHYFCTMVGQTPMHAANGGTASNGGCSPPRPVWIDWILGSPQVKFSGYVRDNSPLGRTSDHPILVTEVEVTGKPGQRPPADSGDN